MKTIGLFRHAKSDWHDARARDFDRGLNERGRKGAALMGRHIHEYDVGHGLGWDRILASPAVRVAETIELGAAEIGIEIPIVWDRRIYLASSASLLDLLREQDDRMGSIMLVGHNPGLEDVIFDLVPDDGTSPLRDEVEIKFPTATFAVLEAEVDSWADLADRCARMIHMKRPRDLDPALGPVAEDW